MQGDNLYSNSTNSIRMQPTSTKNMEFCNRVAKKPPLKGSVSCQGKPRGKERKGTWIHTSNRVNPSHSLTSDPCLQLPLVSVLQSFQLRLPNQVSSMSPLHTSTALFPITMLAMVQHLVLPMLGDMLRAKYTRSTPFKVPNAPGGKKKRLAEAKTRPRPFLLGW